MKYVILFQQMSNPLVLFHQRVYNLFVRNKSIYWLSVSLNLIGSSY